MSDLIKREDAINVIEQNSYYVGGRGEKLKLAIAEIKALPSADRPVDPYIFTYINALENHIKELEKDRPQGEWRDSNGNFIPLDKEGYPAASVWCSHCGEWLVASDEYYVKGWFCPNCGYKMKRSKW